MLFQPFASRMARISGGDAANAYFATPTLIIRENRVAPVAREITLERVGALNLPH
jgi:hypothetical protein